MIKNTAAQRRHKIYLRSKNALRDQHQDDYTLMLERHAQELDTLWANYNLSVKKLASEHNKKTVKSRDIKSKAVPIRKKKVVSVEPEEKVIH
ncbi:MAG: hypothetical protein H0U72_04860 [Nitrosospira sp.]|nr:hypothetical protein [Nitrosospira sp.]